VTPPLLIGLARVTDRAWLKELFGEVLFIPRLVADEVITGGFPAEEAAASPQHWSWLAPDLLDPSQPGLTGRDRDEGESGQHSPGPCTIGPGAVC